ncbi:nitrogen regulation protein NR(II) [Neptunicella marina]|uniref:Sensory histidine kinase/phosphatase NtrB n=1 Tax=Neptunicella marina TaxID=2125989 RepID=A0A8J6J129_9ALTE|nr:nitrogen regulation protein NR(II) [Neptunicella marina]MBC3767895.1 nitrogen regulation protein NR(II) [Neptunicella marina]
MLPNSDNINLTQFLTTAVIVVDENLTIISANPAAETIIEVSINRLIGFPLPELFSSSTLHVSRLLRTLKQTGSFSDSEVQIVFPDGRHRLVDVTISHAEITGSPHLVLEIKLIDQQKRISKETQQWNQQQAAKELVRGLAHEIKNPLGGLRGAAQLLGKQLESDELKEFTEIIIEQADRLTNLVDRLLGPNKLSAFAYRNVHEVLEKVRSLLQLDNISEVVINRDYDPSIPNLWFDSDQLQQAVLNIARNAVQVLQGRGEIQFITRIERQLTIHGQRFPLCVKIQIIDNGPGIPVKLKDTLFYPMVTGKKDGTGLGLSIAQNIIDHHKGKIEVESWPGHTEFNIYLPIIENKEPA